MSIKSIFLKSVFLNILLSALLLTSCEQPYKPFDNCDIIIIAGGYEPSGLISFTIVSGVSGENLVDTTNLANIQVDSVKIFNQDLMELDIKSRNISGEWFFTGFNYYHGISLESEDELVELDTSIFYLKTSKFDYDTIEVIFDRCVMNQIFFNGIEANQFGIVGSYQFKK